MMKTRTVKKRKLLPALLAAALLLMSVSVCANAADGNETYNWGGENSALSVGEDGAVTLTGGGTLTLTADTTANMTVSAGTVTLNLGGHTLTGCVTSYGTLTITNGTIQNSSRCLNCIDGETTVESSATLTCSASDDATIFVGQSDSTHTETPTLNV